MPKILSILDKLDKTEQDDPTLKTPLSQVLGVEWKKLVIGQDYAIDTMVPYVNRFLAGLSVPGKPAANLFLCGPTGSGKTKIVQALAKILHDSERKLIRVNCGEYQSDHEVAKIIGSPPGYLGHRETQPIITMAKMDACKSPTCKMTIILWDEIEKAAAGLFRLLLGMMDEAKLTLGNGDTVSLDNCLMCFTANVGSKEIENLLAPRFGFDLHKPPADLATVKAIKSAAKNAFRKIAAPEFINRVDEIIAFKSLTEDDISRIVELELTALQQIINDRLEERAFNMYFSKPVLKFLATEGFDAKYGARELKRVINRNVYNLVTNGYLDGTIEPCDSVGLHMRGNEVIFKAHQQKPISDEEEDAA